MDKQRQEAYFDLIHILLNFPSVQAKILAANEELIDAGFFQTLQVLEISFLQRGDRNTANRLQRLTNDMMEELSSYLREALRLNTKVDLPSLSGKERNTYFQFFSEVIQAILRNRSNPLVVYPLLENNVDKLDGVLIEILRQWGANTLREARGYRAEYLAAVMILFGTSIAQFPGGDKASNMEIAITSCEVALIVYTQQAFSRDWAVTQANLGNAYSHRIRGERAGNIEQAIAYYQEALKVFTFEDFPQDWANAQNNLGNAYSNRIRGERAQNIEEAITYYQEALKVFTFEAFSSLWATTQNNLGTAYFIRIRDDKANNLEQAIAYFKESLKVYTFDNYPYEWARTLYNLANAYSNRIREERAQNIEQAIAYFKESLKAYTFDNYPYEWAKTLNHLANAYRNRIRGERAQNIEQAIVYYQEALTVRAFDALPQDWANTQVGLANTYCDRIKEDKAENLELAINYYQEALRVYTFDAFPENWAQIQNNLGTAYNDRIRGERAENLEQAITCCKKALQVYTIEQFPQDWAMAQNNLGTAYLYRIRESRAENLERALFCYQEALKIYTFNSFSQDWAQIQNNLGNVYNNRIRKERADNLEQAIVHYQESLRVYTFDTFPYEWARTHNNLTNAYLNRIREDRSKNLEQAIAFGKEALEVFTFDQFPQDWAGAQNNLAVAYRNRIIGDKAENIEQAITCLQEASKVYTFDDFPEKWATTQTNLANVYLDRIRKERESNIELAIAHYQKPLILRVYTVDAFPDEWAQTQNNLGIAYCHRIIGNKAKNIEQAIVHYQESLRVYTFDAFPEQWARTQINFAAAYLDRIGKEQADNLEQAITYCQKALRVYTFNTFPRQWATVQNNLGTAYSKRIIGEPLKNLESAIAYYQEALKVFTFDTLPQNYAETAFYLGRIYQGSKQFNLAQIQFESVITRVEYLREEIVSGDESKRKQAERFNEVYLRMVEVCLKLSNITEALEYAERSKTRNLVEQILERDSQNIFPLEVVTKLETYRDEIAKGQDQIQNATAEDPTALAQHLQQLRQQRNELQDQYLPIGSGFQFEPFRSSLSDRTAIVEFYITTDKLLVFVITKQTQQPIVLSPDLINPNKLANWANSYLKAYSNKKYHWQRRLTTRLHLLAKILHIDEIVQQIPTEYNKLILIPHRYLHLLPLHSLPLTEDSSLFDRFPEGVSYAPSCQLLQLAQTRQRSEFTHLFAVQNPTGDLSYTDLEVETIQSYFNTSNLLKQKIATKEAIDKTSLTVVHCAHFSCHGYFNGTEPRKSALLLADSQLNSAPTQPDTENYLSLENGGVLDLNKCLTLDSIFPLNLEQCRLVTLSACETGLIDFRNTSDEYIGLPSGFLFAGASNVVSSLWTVNDLSTAFLMIRFYQNLQNGLTVGLALNQAQLWLKNLNKGDLETWIEENSLKPAVRMNLRRRFYKLEDKAKPFKSPFYWAAFCAIGIS